MRQAPRARGALIAAFSKALAARSLPNPYDMTSYLLMAMIGGLAFSLIAVAYRACSTQGIPLCFPAMGIGLAGTLYFGLLSFGSPHAPGYDAPPEAWLWGLVNGMAQGFSVHLYRWGLRMGPLAPVWCAGNLGFVTPALFAVAVVGERLSQTQIAGMGLAVFSVWMGALGLHGNSGATTPTKNRIGKARVLYAGLLVLLVFFSGLMGVGLKHMTVMRHDGSPMNPRWNNCFMLGLYATFLIWVTVLAAGCRPPRGTWGSLVLYSLLAAIGSVIGMTMTTRVSDWPGGIGFAVLSVTSLLGGSVFSSFGFGEKRGPLWYLTLGAALAALILFQI